MMIVVKGDEVTSPGEPGRHGQTTTDQRAGNLKQLSQRPAGLEEAVTAYRNLHLRDRLNPAA